MPATASASVCGGTVARSLTVARRPSFSAMTLATSAARSEPKKEGGHALGDTAAEQTGGRGHHHQRHHRCGARRLTEQGHIVRVTPEASDVVAHPLQRSDLVEQSPVGTGAADPLDPFTAPRGFRPTTNQPAGAH